MSVKLYTVKVTATLHTSHHDGYCSDEECDLTSESVQVVVDVPKRYMRQVATTGTVPLHPTDVWEALLPQITLQFGSGYCGLSAQCVAMELDRHDHRYTVHGVEVVCTSTALPASMPPGPRQELITGGLTPVGALELLQWASRTGDAVALQCVRQHADISAEDAGKVISVLATAAADGLVDVFDFWRREYGLCKEDVCDWRARFGGPLRVAVNHKQVALLQWFQATYRITRNDFSAYVVHLLVEAARDAAVLRCLVHGFRASEDDIRDAIYYVVTACVDDDDSERRCDPQRELGLLLDALAGKLQ